MGGLYIVGCYGRGFRGKVGKGSKSGCLTIRSLTIPQGASKMLRAFDKDVS
jgi:hypothetical protein